MVVTAIGANMFTERVVVETVATDDPDETGSFYDLDDVELAP